MPKNKLILSNLETTLPIRSTIKESQKCSTDCRESIITDNISGDIFCRSCGHVLKERTMDTSQESYYDITNYIAKKQTAPLNSITMHDTNTATIISNKDGLGKNLSSKSKVTFYRLKQLNSRRTGSANNKSLKSSFLLLNALHLKLGLPNSLIESAAYLYRKAMRDKIIVGKNAKNLMCACIYIACKKHGVSRSILEISFVSNIGKKGIARAYWTLAEKMEIPPSPFNPVGFITRIANQAGISEKSRRDAIEILSIVEKEKLSGGKNPKALAAASLYLACRSNNERKSQNELARASGITVTTIKTRYSDLMMNIFEE